MSLLSDLINLNLTDTTEKIIAEYVWWVFYLSIALSLFLLWLLPVFFIFVFLLAGSEDRDSIWEAKLGYALILVAFSDFGSDSVFGDDYRVGLCFLFSCFNRFCVSEFGIDLESFFFFFFDVSTRLENCWWRSFSSDFECFSLRSCLVSVCFKSFENNRCRFQMFLSIIIYLRIFPWIDHILRVLFERLFLLYQFVWEITAHIISSVFERFSIFFLGIWNQLYVWIVFWWHFL